MRWVWSNKGLECITEFCIWIPSLYSLGNEGLGNKPVTKECQCVQSACGQL